MGGPRAASDRVRHAAYTPDSADEHGADARAAEVAQAHGVLQAVADAVATARGFDDVVPTVLAIAARAFGVDAAGFFERAGDDGTTLFLRYWLYEGRVLRPAELLAADPTMPRQWLGGVPAPLGSPVCASPGADVRLGAATFDHATTPPVRACDAWLCANGWPLVLHVPCVVGGSARGSLVLARTADAPYTRSEVALAEALAIQLGLAVAAARLAQEVHERAVEGAIAREREHALEVRAAEMTRAHDALQAVTDALATARGAEEIVPAVLDIAARTFGAGAGAYFEHGGDHGDVVALRYWLHEGRVLRPAELLAADVTIPRRWFDGFTVPAAYLDVATPAARTRAIMIDHGAGTAEPEFDAWCRAHSCELELNVPCAVGGVARGGLVLCRTAPPYTAAELGLAEALGNQLALALEADRLAREVRERAVESAVVRERERAAEERAAELARANVALRETANRLAGAPDLTQYLQQTLVLITRELQADNAVAVTYDAGGDAFTVTAVVMDGAPAEPGAAPLIPAVCARDAAPYFDRVLEAPAGYAAFDVARDRALFAPAVADFLVAHGLTTTLAFPIRLAGRLLGRISVAFAAPPALTPGQTELVEALANQAALAIELTRLAREAQAAAVAGERNALAREVHDTLAQGFSGIVMQLGAAREQLGAAACAAPALARVERLAREHLAEARRSIAALRPEQAHRGGAAATAPCTPRGLAVELRRVVDAARDAHVAVPGAAADVAVAVLGAPRRLPADVEFELLRVAQAALTNALRHAHARQVRVELAFAPAAEVGARGGDASVGAGPNGGGPAGGVRITVADDGRGFDPDAAYPGRFGLVGMGERAARVGAALTVVTAPDEGTEVVVMWRPTEVA